MNGSGFVRNAGGEEPGFVFAVILVQVFTSVQYLDLLLFKKNKYKYTYELYDMLADNY